MCDDVLDSEFILKHLQNKFCCGRKSLFDDIIDEIINEEDVFYNGNGSIRKKEELIITEDLKIQSHLIHGLPVNGFYY
jgi:hypothetical protein